MRVSCTPFFACFLALVGLEAIAEWGGCVRETDGEQKAEQEEIRSTTTTNTQQRTVRVKQGPVA